MFGPRFPGLVEVLVVNARRRPEVIAHAARQRLCALVRFAGEQVPFYREAWRKAGFDPRQFRGPEDLPRLPLTTKADLVEAGSAAHAPFVRRRRVDRMRTSGTSGRAIELVRLPRELRLIRRSILRHFLWIGMRPWHRTVTVASGWLKSRRGYVMERISHVRHIEAQATLGEQIRTLEEFRPVALIGQTGGIYLLARELIRRGRPFPLRWVVPTGATLMPEMRRAMVQAFGVDPCDMYGAIEVGPISWQCQHGAYHIDADRLIVEVVDSGGLPVPWGKPGQVVVTSLCGWAMPFIRYQLQDISALSATAPPLPAVPTQDGAQNGGMHLPPAHSDPAIHHSLLTAYPRCSCGCRFPTMAPVQGRINDFLPTPAGDLVSPHFFFHLFDDLPRNPVSEWRIVQESATGLAFEYVPEAWGEPAAIEHGLARIRQRFGPSCTVVARRVTQLPMTPSGKRRCIISRLRPPAVPLEEVWAEPDA